MADWKSSQEFLKEFYASPIVNEDTISAKIKRIFLPKSRKASALKELAGDLSGEGRAGDVILDNDMFEMDTEICKKQVVHFDTIKKISILGKLITEIGRASCRERV